jgi:hypothetical protein
MFRTKGSVGQESLLRIPVRGKPHRIDSNGGKHTMFRMSMYVLGISAFVAAWAAYRYQQKTMPMPVREAAAKLQKAWADNHTQS